MIKFAKIKIARTWVAIFISTFAVCLLGSCHTAQAQGHPSPLIDPIVETVSSRLRTLTTLPADHWRFHPGDMAHGEDVALDDSNWTVVGEKRDAPLDAAWYRAVVIVPPTLNGYDLTGTKLWFRFKASANGAVPEIVYFNGRRVAMGEDLEPIVLLDPVKPGDRVLIAVKLLQTVDKKRFEEASIEVEFPASRPSPLDLRQELDAVKALVPSLAVNIEAVDNFVTAAAKAVDLNSLTNANQAAFDASLLKAHSILIQSRPDLQQTSVALTGNSHIDAAWLWPWSETANVVRSTFSTALQLMHEYPEYTYTQSAAAYNQWMEEKYPSVHQQIVNRVKEGRWEMVGGMWVEPDLNMPDGESLVRQLLIGKRYFKQRFGVDVRIGWNPDSFGYNWQLPQIYKRSGIDYFVTQKMAWNDTNKLPLKLFWWQSPDGSRVLTYFPHDYVNEIDPVKISSDVAVAQQLNPGAGEMMHLYGVGDHGGGPTRSMLDSGLRWTKPDRVVPEMHFSTAQAFFSEIEKHVDNQDAPTWNYKLMAKGNAKLPAPAAGKLSLPVWNDELYFEYHRGVLTTQANHKRNMRKSEVQLLDAEKYSSIAWLMGGEYPQASLSAAWQKALFNQFHDLAAGSGINAIYKDAQRDYDAIRWSTDEASAAALKTISSRVNTVSGESGVPVMIVNSLAWPRADLAIFSVQLPTASPSGIAVLDDRGRVLQFQQMSYEPSSHTYRLLVKVEDVPSLGYEILHVRPAAGVRAKSLQSKVIASSLTLENSLLRLTVDPKTGCLTSIYQKTTKFESIASGGCGNQLQTFKDNPKDYDAWNIDADFDKQMTPLDNAESVELVEKGPLRATIRITRVWQKSKFIQDVSLYAGLDRIDLENKIDWHETHILLKAAFPLAAVGSQATYEIPYGSIERPTTRDNSWEAAKFEVPALRWADLGDGDHGFSVINESKYGYDAKGNVLRLSLLRSPTWPDPEADRGHHKFSYSLYPHRGDWKHALTIRRGYEFNYPLNAFQVAAHDGVLPSRHSFVGVTGDNVIVTALKKSEDDNALILRLYEWAGKAGSIKVNLPEHATGVSRTDLMEKTETAKTEAEGHPTLSGDEATIPVSPYEIVSVRVDFANHH